MKFLRNFTTRRNKLKLVTHDGPFHADDIFAASALILYLEKQGKSFEIVRTRDEEKIKRGDYVFDVGGVYDEAKNRFDHHQSGGAGKHANGAEYSSFGLVWEKIGVELCGSKKVAEIIEAKLVSPIDSADNGISLVELKGELVPYFVQTLFSSFIPNWKDINEETLLQGFLRCLEIAKMVLKNEVDKAQAGAEAEELVEKIYRNASDKRIIVFDKRYPSELLEKYPEPFFGIYPRVDDFWGVKAVSAQKGTFENRKNFPKEWAGLRDADLAKVSGVPDAIFCHRALFMAVAKSREGAIALAQKALEAN